MSNKDPLALKTNQPTRREVLRQLGPPASCLNCTVCASCHGPAFPRMSKSWWPEAKLESSLFLTRCCCDLAFKFSGCPSHRCSLCPDKRKRGAWNRHTHTHTPFGALSKLLLLVLKGFEELQSYTSGSLFLRIQVLYLYPTFPSGSALKAA